MQAIYGNEQNPELFPKLTPAEMGVLADYGTMTAALPGEVLYHEGNPERLIYVVLTGKLLVYKLIGCEDELVATHEPGDFAGDILMQIGAPASATLRPAVRSVLIQIETSSLHRIVTEHPELGNKIVNAFARRSLELVSQGGQAEKLAALGRLAAGIAHEINNPASVVTSAVRRIRSLLDLQGSALRELRRGHFPLESEDFLGELYEALAGRSAASRNPVELSDREAALEDWLTEHSLPGLMELAPAFIHHDVRPKELAAFLESVPRECLPSAFRYLHCKLELRDSLEQAESAGDRIVKLVSAVKEYTYLDRNPMEQVDLHRGIENALTLLQDRIKRGIRVVRDFDPGLQTLEAHGSELNEVWTNLLINAADAMQDKGVLTVRTRREKAHALVEVEDSGHGIPVELQNRIYEPFFTTKPVGTGTGLGLDISRRIVEKRHQGSMAFQSSPGKTVFQVRLPMEREKTTDLAGPAKPEAPLAHPIAPGDHLRARGKAGVQILFYGDYQCPFTWKAQQVLQDTFERYPQVPYRLAFRHFPLIEVHQHALLAALASEAAHAQQKFWIYHDELLRPGVRLEEGALLELAAKLGLDWERFRRDLKSKETERRVLSHRKQGREDGVDITPTLFLNGRAYNGPIQFEALSNSVLRLAQVRQSTPGRAA